jgi:predicted HAD superfamily Cof-like phosphohydrolase
LKKAYQDVLDFHTKFFRDRIAECPTVPQDDLLEFRIKLMEEEFRELMEALRKGDLIKVADGMADTIYTIVGTAVTYGIPLPEVWDEIHRSNMTKQINSEGNYIHGKACKGEAYEPPNLAKVFFLQRVRNIAKKVVIHLNDQLDDYYWSHKDTGPYFDSLGRVKFDKENNSFYLDVKLVNYRAQPNTTEDRRFEYIEDSVFDATEGRCIAEHIQPLGYIHRLEYRENQ